MILPLLRGLLPLHLTPATWFLFALNVLVFLVNFPRYASSQDALDQYFSDTQFMRTQGVVFSQFVAEQPSAHSHFLRRMAERATAGDHSSQFLMGGFAIRNREFMEAADTRPFKGDVIALAQWKHDFKELREIQAVHPNYKWGLSAIRSDWTSWITYQFAHSGFQHLMWNMIIFVLFATFLEAAVGSSLVILIYLGSGFAGAAVFSALSGLTYSPLIGASGAVTGIMACVTILLWNERIRFMYWLLPVRGYFGIRDLPAWLVAIAYLVPDLAGQFSAISDVNGMAYSAHLGGALLGGFGGFAIRQGWLEREDTPPPTEEEIW